MSRSQHTANGGWLRRRPARGAADGGTTPALDDVLAELVLLREENARLTAAAHQPADLGRVVARMRSVAAEPDGRAADGDSLSDGDEVAQMLVDGVVLRESLMEVCRELESSVAAVRGRLGGIAVEERHGSAAGGL